MPFSNAKQGAGLLWITNAGGAALLIGLALGTFCARKHLLRERASLDEVQTHDRLLLRKAAELRGEADEAKDKLRELEQSLVALKERLPRTANEAEFLTQISALADQALVKLVSFRPGKATQASNLSCTEIQLTLSGPYGNLCTSLAQLRRLPRFLSVTRLTLSGPQTAGGACLAEVTINLYFAPAVTLALAQR